MFVPAITDESLASNSACNPFQSDGKQTPDKRVPEGGNGGGLPAIMESRSS
jgi:hypothetical protein